MPSFYLPLSGDVTQTFNPTQWFYKFGSAQVGLFNINLGHSADPDVEWRVLQEVATYGSQIGRLGDALEAVLAHMPTDKWDKPAKDAVEDFRSQLRQIRKVKEQQSLLPKR